MGLPDLVDVNIAQLSAHVDLTHRKNHSGGRSQRQFTTTFNNLAFPPVVVGSASPLAAASLRQDHHHVDRAGKAVQRLQDVRRNTSKLRVINTCAATVSVSPLWCVADSATPHRARGWLPAQMIVTKITQRLMRKPVQIFVESPTIAWQPSGSPSASARISYQDANGYPPATAAMVPPVQLQPHCQRNGAVENRAKTQARSLLATIFSADR